MNGAKFQHVISTFVLVLFATFATSTIPDAHADTNYFNTGQSCKSVNNDSSISYSSNGVVNNSASSSKTVWCPINGNESNTVDLNGAAFFTYDASTSAQVSCTIYVRDRYGTYYISSTENSYDGYTGYKEIDWTVANLPNYGNSISNACPYAFYCTLPSTASGTFYMRGYMVTQLNP